MTTSTSRLPACITYSEALANVGSSLNALVHFFRAFNERDLLVMEQARLTCGKPSMDNPIGGTWRGLDAISEGCNKVFDGRARVNVESHDLTPQGDEHDALAVGREHGWFELPSARVNLAVGTPCLFVMRGGFRRPLQHHHSIDDGELLAEHQRAVLSAPVREANR